MCEPRSILNRAQGAGLRVWREGDRIAFSPARLCPPELLAEIRTHKRQLLSLLEAKADGLAPDCAPWLHTAKQVLAGEFEGCDSSWRKSLIIGLRSIGHSLCKEALRRLQRGLKR